MTVATFADTARTMPARTRPASPYFHVQQLPAPGRCQSCRRTGRELHVLRDWTDGATFEVCEECRLD